MLLPGKRKSNENAASTPGSTSKKRVIFKDYQLSGLRQAFEGTNGHASPELTGKLAETLDLEAKQVRLMSFPTLYIILSLKKVYLVYFIKYH